MDNKERIEGQDQETFRDSIATVDQSGKRIWIYPKKPSGIFYKYRKLLSYLLLALLFGMPFIKVNGHQFMLFDILDREFVHFRDSFCTTGLSPFCPGDAHFDHLYRLVYGRLWPPVLWMDLSPDHFYGDALSTDRVLD